MDYQSLIKKIKRVVIKASKLCFDSFNIEVKDQISNIVTTADKNIQKFLDEKLSKLIPNSTFYQEEQNINQTSENYIWIIDPIDGTENFSRGIKDFSISVALAYSGKIVLGVVYIPKTREMFSAIEGCGAYLNNKKIHVSNRNFNESLFATALCLYKKENAKYCSEILNRIYPNIKDFRRFGSCACELCYLAKGEIELFFEIRVFLWDFAASLIILKEAGGYICGANAKEIKLNEITPIIAANTKENLDKLNQVVNQSIEGASYE